jgi:aminoglycoside 6'-N-acetyltransferase I
MARRARVMSRAPDTLETISLEAASADQREQAAAILVAALAHAPSAWHDMAAARQQVSTFIGRQERLAIAAVEGERLLGWIGAIRHSRHAWELHPLVVDPAHQRRGCGTLLVKALEDEARRAGICTIWLGADDDFGGTSLFGLDLFPDVLGRLQRLIATGKHPYAFYRRQGYALVGVLPDVEGPGRHDILMAKRI